MKVVKKYVIRILIVAKNIEIGNKKKKNCIIYNNSRMIINGHKLNNYDKYRIDNIKIN